MDDKTKQLIIRAQNNDNEATEILIKMNIGLVYSLISRFKTNSYYQDLYQIGCMGLFKAIKKFDFNYDVMFSTYAVPIIMGEVKRYFRDEGQMKVSRSIKENYLKINRAKEILSQKNSIEPTVSELANYVGIDVSDCIIAIESNQYLTSLDQVYSQSDGSKVRLDEKIEDHKKLDISMKIALEKEIAQLTQREKMIIHYRYNLEYNQSEIAKKLNVSQVQISRLEKQILLKLKDRLK